jgi:hypothetical protein
VRAVDVQRVDLIYQCYCIAEAGDGQVAEYLMGYRRLWVHLQQKKGLLPKDDPSAFKVALKKLALDRATRALTLSARSQRITTNSDGKERVEELP